VYSQRVSHRSSWRRESGEKGKSRSHASSSIKGKKGKERSSPQDVEDDSDLAYEPEGKGIRETIRDWRSEAAAQSYTPLGGYSFPSGSQSPIAERYNRHSGPAASSYQRRSSAAAGQTWLPARPAPQRRRTDDSAWKPIPPPRPAGSAYTVDSDDSEQHQIHLDDREEQYREASSDDETITEIPRDDGRYPGDTIQESQASYRDEVLTDAGTETTVPLDEELKARLRSPPPSKRHGSETTGRRTKSGGGFFGALAGTMYDGKKKKGKSTKSAGHVPRRVIHPESSASQASRGHRRASITVGEEHGPTAGFTLSHALDDLQFGMGRSGAGRVEDWVEGVTGEEEQAGTSTAWLPGTQRRYKARR
jgi:hypothetical protein